LRLRAPRRLTYTSAKAETTLGWAPRPLEQTIAETGRSMVDLGVV
jgi:nucleoside-diphosphate-sugar epimerase